jgi:hypothetical protein
LKWQEAFVDQLTPWHLAGAAGPACAAHPLVSALHTQLANAFLLFTAERSASIPPPGGRAAPGQHLFQPAQAGFASLAAVSTAGQPPPRRIISSYVSTRQALDVAHAAPETYSGPALSAAQAGALISLLDWAYDPAWSAADRLGLVQLAVVDALRGAEAARAFELLLENAPDILESVRFLWKGFLEGRIDAYTAQVDELEKAASEAVRGYSEQVAALVKSLSEAVLAAVGVLIGTFIAALFEKNFNAQIFRIGLLAYSGYVFLFPLCLQMFYQWQAYRLLGRDFETRRLRFIQRLPRSTVDQLLHNSPLAASQAHFRVWFALTLACYLALAGLGVWAAFNLPALLGLTGP